MPHESTFNVLNACSIRESLVLFGRGQGNEGWKLQERSFHFNRMEFVIHGAGASTVPLRATLQGHALTGARIRTKVFPWRTD
jgi:hypothetical protein